MKINVTDNHIINGKRGECQQCPLALAVNTKPDCFNAMVYDTVLLFLQDKKIWRAYIPQDVQKWLVAFDLNEPVKPMSFNIHPTLIPEEYL